MQKVILATTNNNKVHELSLIINNLGLDLILQTELGITCIEETGLTFIENAILKARHAAKITQLPVIADDSGLTVDALNGAPGVYSARYAGTEMNNNKNIAKLLKALKDVPDNKRHAQLHCVIVYMRHANDAVPIICHGSWHGMITHEALEYNSFGYDSVFFIPNKGRTAADLTYKEKCDISHRGQAMKQLVKALSNDNTLINFHK